MAQAYPMQVLAEMLGCGAGSRLYKSLVLDRGLALSAGTYYSPSTIDLAIFGLHATPKPGVFIAALEAAIDGELRRLVRDGVDPDELRPAKERMQEASVSAKDRLSRPAHIIAAAAALFQLLARDEALPQRIGAAISSNTHTADAPLPPA